MDRTADPGWARAAWTAARWDRSTLANSGCSHHIRSLAPAVALPAPRHDRRRTGAAGSPPGGFPFVEFRRAAVKFSCDCGRALQCVPLGSSPARTILPFIPAHSASKTRVNALMLGIRRPALGPPATGSPRRERRGGAPRGDERKPSRIDPLRPFPGQWELALLQDAALAGDRGGIPAA